MKNLLCFLATLPLFMGTPVLAQFDPEVTTDFDDPTGGVVTGFSQRQIYPTGDEALDTAIISIDGGRLDFTGLEVDDELGTLIVTTVTPGPGFSIISRTLCDLVVTEVGDDSMSADAERVSIVGSGGGEVVFSIAAENLDTGVEVTVNDEDFLGPQADAEVTVFVEVIAVLEMPSDEDLVTVTTELTSQEGSEVSIDETFELATVPEQFLRGDVDGDGSVTPLLDALRLLNWAFGDASEPPCLDAADADDNGAVSGILDGLRLLQWGFSDGEAPPDPGVEECGDDPTEDAIECDQVPCD